MLHRQKEIWPWLQSGSGASRALFETHPGQEAFGWLDIHVICTARPSRVASQILHPSVFGPNYQAAPSLALNIFARSRGKRAIHSSKREQSNCIVLRSVGIQLVVSFSYIGYVTCEGSKARAGSKKSKQRLHQRRKERKKIMPVHGGRTCKSPETACLEHGRSIDGKRIVAPCLPRVLPYVKSEEYPQGKNKGSRADEDQRRQSSQV